MPADWEERRSLTLLRSSASTHAYPPGSPQLCHQTLVATGTPSIGFRPTAGCSGRFHASTTASFDISGNPGAYKLDSS